MPKTPILSAFFLSILATAGAPPAKAQEDWKPINDAAELRQIISGNSFDGKHFWDYYRSDGVMAYYNVDYDTVVVRKWVVRDDATICTYIYVKRASWSSATHLSDRPKIRTFIGLPSSAVIPSRRS